jgi:LacI family transcriptional regulator
MPNQPRVAIIVGTHLIYARDILHGILDYTHQVGHWKLFVENWWEAAPFPSLRECDGVIAHLYDESLARQVLVSGIPTVNISSIRVPGTTIPQVISDNHAVGRMGARYLIDTGLRQLAFCGYPDREFSQQRCQGFGEGVNEANKEFLFYQGPQQPYHALSWEQQMDDLREWVRILPTPVGVMGCNDFRARHVVDIARELGLDVPGEVSVLGVDNDDLVCAGCDPALSSIALDGYRVGQEACALLEKLMQRQSPPTEPILVEPSRVFVRASTRVPAGAGVWAGAENTQGAIHS